MAIWLPSPLWQLTMVQRIASVMADVSMLDTTQTDDVALTWDQTVPTVLMSLSAKTTKRQTARMLLPLPRWIWLATAHPLP